MFWTAFKESLMTKGFYCARDYWARFERFVKKITDTYDDVYVITGPLYLSRRTEHGYVLQHPMIGMIHTANQHHAMFN